MRNRVTSASTAAKKSTKVETQHSSSHSNGNTFVSRSLFVGEEFSEVHHKIIDGLGTILSNLGANSGVMSIVMSWGDTQDSVSTLEMLNDYIEKHIPKLTKILNEGSVAASNKVDNQTVIIPNFPKDAG